jgi:uncharacterized membrane protein
MTYIQYLYLYLATIPVFFAIDIVWLGLVAKNFYSSQIGHLMGPVNMPAALIFYLLFIVGIIIFAVSPALSTGSLAKALILGALFGFFTYATYDLTNLATLKDWPIIVTIVDLVWGSFLSASVSGVSYWIGKTFII